jgi:hypothetical protein
MDIKRLRRAIDIIHDEQAVLSARQTTYLRTYRALVDLAALPTDDSHRRFLQLATGAYGWMPRIVRIDPDHLARAVAALADASRASEAVVQESVVKPIAACLHSVVGASKVLHFANPDVFPIWDTKVERVWRQPDPSQHYMGKSGNYVRYAEEVHQLRKHQDFAPFLSGFRSAYETRLRALGIPHYVIGEVRAIEAAAFELSGGEYEGA